MNPQLHVLYRHFSTNGELLYVGISADPGRRLTAHATQSQWWTTVAGITLEHFVSRDELRQAERIAIQVEHPRHNKMHNAQYRRPPQRTTPTPIEPSPPEPDRVTINGRRYILPPALRWDNTRQRVVSRE